AADEAGKNFMTNKVGVGYQGMVVGSLLNGLSARGWIGDRVGLEGSVFYGQADVDIEYGGSTIVDAEADLWMLEFKAMYAFIVRENSKFYVGGKLGYGQLSVSEGGDDFLDGESIWTPGVFVGAEWNIPSLPELGFNFDVGYTGFIFDNDVEGADVELQLHGLGATFGLHYYF
ncbi:MAG: hypothetical protein WC373_09885, partial [Smithella sp.]